MRGKEIELFEGVFTVKDLIKKLTEVCSPSGREDAIADTILDLLKGHIDGYERDRLGNLIVWKKGRSGKKILLDAHMDEIGVIVTNIDENGFLRIDPIGGVNPRILLGARLIIDEVVGVVGVEGESRDELEENLKKMSFDKIYVDIGVRSKEEAEKKVRIGSFGTYLPCFADLGNRILSKSMDDRVGCAVLVEVLREIDDPKNDVYCVFAVQEEVGIVGARVAGFDIEPDVAVAVDVTGVGDTPKALKRISMRLGCGPALKVMDGRTISDRKLLNMMENLARELGIPYQMEVLPFGGTDAFGYQLTRSGIPSMTLSIPTRYIHTPNEMVDFNDVLNTVELLREFVKI